MDNDDALIGRILTRREALRTTMRLGVGLALTRVLARNAFAANSIPTTQPHLPLIAAPAMTEGPFFVDEKLNRSNLLGDTTRASVVNGLPLLLSFTVYKLSGNAVTPLPNVMIDVWHADASGAYSDESDPMNHEDTAKQNWLRGYQVTDTAGAVQFQTIFPGWYEGRTPHLHFKVRQLPDKASATKTPSGKEFTSQLFFREPDIRRVYSTGVYASTAAQRDTSNADDGIYSERLNDGTRVGDVMLLDLQPSVIGQGSMANFPIVLTDESMHSGRRHDFGPPPGMGGPPDDFRPEDFPPLPRDRQRPTSRPAGHL